MSGCNECKYHESHLNWDGDKLGKSTYSCKNGKTKEAIKWWEENGRKISEPLDYMPCHEYTDSRKSLNEMSDKLDEMLKILR